MPEARRIGLFGGTFDPVHRGHLHIAGFAREALGLDEVSFIPCRISPHKLAAGPTSAAHRLAMLRAATAGLPWARIDDLELRREGPSYSWQTAAEIRDHDPAARLFWIMGSDQWQALPDWAHPERLAACVEFAVVTRGTPVAAQPGFRHHPILCRHPASATTIRRELAAGADPHPWLDPAVMEHIREHRLYGIHSSMSPE